MHAGTDVTIAATPGARPATVFHDRLVSAAGSSRGTGYIESNKVVATGERVHVAWLDAGQGGPEPVRVRTLDPQSDAGEPAVTLGEATDNHGGPALIRDAGGYLHAVFGPHHGPFTHRRSVRPDDASAWTPPVQFGTRCTYPSLVCDAANTLHLVCREADAPGWRLMYYRRPDGGEWSVGKPLVKPTHADGTYRCYRASLVCDRQGTLHLGFMLFGGEHFHKAREEGLAGYLRSDDAGTTWTHFHGQAVRSLPSDTDFDRVPVTHTCIRTGNLAVDDHGRPFLATVSTGFRGYADRWGEARLWRREPDGWHVTPLNPFVEKAYPGHRVSWAEPSLTCAADGRLFLALVAVAAHAVNPLADWHGDPGSNYGNVSSRLALLVSDDGGQTFAARRVGRNVPGIPSWLPSLERDTGHNTVTVPHLLYTHGVTGKGCSPQEITAEIRLVTCNAAP